MNNAFTPESPDNNKVILSDALAQNAAEFFIASSITGIKVEVSHAMHRMQALLSDVAQAPHVVKADTIFDAGANPFINDSIVVFDNDSTNESTNESPQTFESDLKHEHVAPKSSIQLYAELDQLLNCTCSDCQPALSCRSQGPSWFSVAIPVLCATLFLLSAVSVTNQLIALSDKNVEQSKQLCVSGKYHESASAALVAISCNPFSSEAYCQRARALVHMLRYNEAEDCLNQALAIDPDCKKALDARASLSIKVGKPNQAIADTNKLLLLQGHKLSVYQWGNLAIAYYSNKNYERAIAAYDKALQQSVKTDSHLLVLKLGRAYCLYGQKHHQQALDACNKLINQYGAKGDILVLRGFCHEGINATAAANKDFDLAIATTPARAAYYADRAAFFAQIHKQKAALNDRLKAADLNRFNAQYQLDAARALKIAGRDREAIAYYDRLALTSTFKQSAEQQEERAALNFKAGRYALSLSDLNRAIALAPSAHLYAMQALCFAHCGQAAPARKAIASALSLQAKDRAILLTDGQVEALLGQTVSAVDKFSQVLAVDADNKEALIGRGQCYFDRGQWASAAQDLNKAIALGGGDPSLSNKLVKCEKVLAGGAKIKLDLPQRKIIDLARLTNIDLSKNGMQAKQDGDMHLAAIYFTELARREPTNIAARCNLAHAFELDGCHEEAVSVFESLSIAESLSADDQFSYAHALAATGHYERSIALLERLTINQPSRVEYKLELIKVVSAAGQIDRAIDLCRSSLSEQSSGTDRKCFNDVYESLVTERLRSQQNGEAAFKANPAIHGETAG